MRVRKLAANLDEWRVEVYDQGPVWRKEYDSPASKRVLDQPRIPKESLELVQDVFLFVLVGLDPLVVTTDLNEEKTRFVVFSGRLVWWRVSAIRFGEPGRDASFRGTGQQVHVVLAVGQSQSHLAFR